MPEAKKVSCAHDTHGPLRTGFDISRLPNPPSMYCKQVAATPTLCNCPAPCLVRFKSSSLFPSSSCSTPMVTHSTALRPPLFQRGISRYRPPIPFAQTYPSLLSFLPDLPVFFPAILLSALRHPHRPSASHPENRTHTPQYTSSHGTLDPGALGGLLDGLLERLD